MKYHEIKRTLNTAYQLALKGSLKEAHAQVHAAVKGGASSMDVEMAMGSMLARMREWQRNTPPEDRL